MVKIYKTKAGQNRFVQIFFSELNVSVAVGILLAIPLYFIDLGWEIKLGLLLVLMILAWSILFHKINKKPLYTLILPAFKFIFSQKRYTSKHLATMSQFYYCIKDNFVFTNDQILKVFQIHPVDISLLNEQEKQTFKNQLGVFLHSIGDDNSIQLKVVNRLAVVKDYEDHFENLRSQARSTNASGQVIKLQNEYIKNLSNKITNEAVPFKDYYIIIPQKTTKNPKPELLESYKKDLVRKVNNLCNLLTHSGIEVVELTEKTLENFYQAQFNRI
jgi:hypothetical protein